MEQGAHYRTTLHPSIWRKDYFLKYLKPGFTAWEFEMNNFNESFIDNATIICQDDTDDIYKSMNVYDKAKPIPRWDSQLPWGIDGDVSDEDKNLVLGYINE